MATALALSQSFAYHPGAKPRLERVEDRNLGTGLQDGFAPARFGRRLWICPKGQSADDPDAEVVEPDPGLAFGTGLYPTIVLCLRWLNGADLTGKTFVDYGCGSGVLAIAALRLGAIRAVAVDHDPQALEATQANTAEYRRLGYNRRQLGSIRRYQRVIVAEYNSRLGNKVALCRETHAPLGLGVDKSRSLGRKRWPD